MNPLCCILSLLIVFCTSFWMILGVICTLDFIVYSTLKGQECIDSFGNLIN